MPLPHPGACSRNWGQRHRNGLTGPFLHCTSASRDRLRRSLASRRAEVVALGYRTRQVVLFAAVTGAVTGLGVAAFEAVTRKGLFDHLAEAPLWLQVVAPDRGSGAGCVGAALARGRRGPATSDEYIRNFHEPGTRLDLRPVPGRLAASIATLGLGGAMGYEGPSMYLGAGDRLRSAASLQPPLLA